jgi:hypothetical protein
MDFKTELQGLVKLVKDYAKKQGRPLKNEDMAKRMGVSRTYFSDLMGAHAEVTQKHIALFKEEFRQEIDEITRQGVDKRRNPERSMLLAFLVDYCESEAKKEGLTPAEVRARIKKRADLISGGLEFEDWLSG